MLQAFTIFVMKLFSSTNEEMLLNCVTISSLIYFMLGKKAPCKVPNLQLYTSFNLLSIT